MRYYTIGGKNVNLENVCCLNITDTTIEICFSVLVGDNLTFTRGTDLSAESFDTHKAELMEIIKNN